MIAAGWLLSLTVIWALLITTAVVISVLGHWLSK